MLIRQIFSNDNIYRFYFFLQKQFVDCSCIPLRRFFSTFIDFYIFNFFFIFFGVLFRYFSNLNEISFVLFFEFSFSFFFAYILPKKVFRGQSIGMLVMQYEILSFDKNKQLSFFQHILRTFAQAFNILAFFIPYFVSIFHSKKIHLADLVSNSHPVVVKSKILNNSFLDIFISLFVFSFFIKNLSMFFTDESMIDLFGNLWYGETARFFLGVIIFFEAAIFIMNLFKVRWYGFISLFYFLMYLFSYFFSILQFSRYRTLLVNKATETYGLYFSLIEKSNPVFDAQAFLNNFLLIFQNILPFLVFFNFFVCLVISVYYLFHVFDLFTLRERYVV